MKARVLVVDDEPDLEALLVGKFRHQMRDGLIEFLFAHDGVEALAVLEQRTDVDMVLTDINMPRMDGLTLLQKLQEATDRKSTVIVSAYDDMANIRTAMNRGAFDFLTKPIDFADLEATIDKTIRHVETLRDAHQRQAAAERASAALARYFSPNLAQRITDSEQGIDLCGQRREVAAVWTDIENFTSLVETLEPEVIGPLLNDYLVGTTNLVFAHEGTVTKIIGDALHILFGAPAEQPDHAARAVALALDLDDYLQGFRATWRNRNISLGVTRIGVHAGPAIVGNFGGDQFFDYTAYGDTINTAARLETANKQLGTRICVSGEVAARVPNFKGRPVGDLVLRGKSEALRAFEPMRPEKFNTPATATYLDAFAKLEAGDAGAMAAFAAHVGAQPDDRLASFHLKRLLNGQTGTRIAMD